MRDAGAKPEPESLANRARPSLTPERWQHIKEAFGQALEAEPNARAACLQKICAGDEWLRVEVESMLLAAESKGAATAEVLPAVSVQTTRLPSNQEADPMLGRPIGAYRIGRRIGYGGMASVYLASRADEEFRKQVAIKILRP